MLKLSPYELGKVAGQTRYETHEAQPVPDFTSEEEETLWRRGEADGYKMAEMEAQHA